MDSIKEGSDPLKNFTDDQIDKIVKSNDSLDKEQERWVQEQIEEERRDFKKKFYLPVGYSNHNNNKQTLNLLTLFKPSVLFIYCKPTKKKGRVYPDNDHAFYLDEINDIIKEINLYSSSIYKSEKISKVNIFANEFKF